MKYVKKFEKFVATQEPAVKPAEPKVAPDTKPGRPSPIRRDKPAVEPDPKAKKKGRKATAKQVAERFISLMNEKGENIKKYISK